MSKKLLVLPKLEMTSREIAELTGKRHDHVLADIETVFIRTTEKLGVVKEPTDTMVSDDSTKMDSPVSLGVVTKTTYKNSQNKTQPMYILDKKAAYVLVSGYNAELRALCFDYIEKLEQDIVRLKAQEVQRQHERAIARAECPLLTDAIFNQRTALGKDTKFYHYANEFDMINRIVLGMTAKKFREINGIDETTLIRDCCTVSEITMIQKLQKLNTALIDMDFDFDERKYKLRVYYDKQMKAVLK